MRLAHVLALRLLALSLIAPLTGCGGGGGGGAPPGGSSDLPPAAQWPGDRIGAGTDRPFDAGEAQGTVVNPDGSITLEPGATASIKPLIWVANSHEGTVSKLDTRTHEELGRYRTGPEPGMDPSRTAVDRDGHVVVSNRGLSSATRVLAQDCPDWNGDGAVTTSTGGTDVLAWGEDECVGWYTQVGDARAIARGTVVEERAELDDLTVPYAWVGAYNEKTMYEIRVEDGALTGRTVSTAPTFPYGAALGPGGKVWVAGADDLAEFDTTTLEVVQHPLPSGRTTYGITVDAEGDVWTGGTVQRYRPRTGAWDWPAPFSTGHGHHGDRAGGVAADLAGHVWAGLGMSGEGILRIETDTLETTVIATGGKEHGVAVDADGMIWGIDLEGDSATIVDPDSLAFERITPPFVGAYTYSDMTGIQTANALHSGGRYRHTFEGCPDDPTTWGVLRWDVRTPGTSQVIFRGRSADEAGQVSSSPAVTLATVPGDEPPLPIAASFPTPGRFVEIEMELRAGAGEDVPTVLAVGLDHSCPDFIE